jgi:hypothetical protein
MIGKETKNQVKNLELELLSAAVRKSPKRLNELLADDFFEFNQSGGVSTKQSIIEKLPKCPEENFSIRNYREKILSSDTILVNYIADRKILESGIERCTLCSSIWQNRSGKWQMIFFQGTPSKN